MSIASLWFNVCRANDAWAKAKNNTSAQSRARSKLDYHRMAFASALEKKHGPKCIVRWNDVGCAVFENASHARNYERSTSVFMGLDPYAPIEMFKYSEPL